MEVPLLQDEKSPLELWILLLPELRTTPIFTSTPGSHCSLLLRGIVEKGDICRRRVSGGSFNP
jgi:hypothetical protein